MQSVDAEPFTGKRIRLAGELRTKQAGTGATIWSGSTTQRVRFCLIISNCSVGKAGPLVGTQGWSERSVVFDIPDEALSLHYGFFLKGAGKCWSRSFSLNEVNGGAPISIRKGPVLHLPTNRDFGKAAAN